MPLSDTKLSAGGNFTARSLALVFLAMLGIAAGLRYGLHISPFPPAETPRVFALLSQYVPLAVFGYLWLIGGIACAIAACIPQRPDKTQALFTRAPVFALLDVVAPAILLSMACTWAAAYLLFWIFAVTPIRIQGNPDAWYSGFHWLALSGLIWVTFMSNAAPAVNWWRRFTSGISTLKGHFGGAR